MKNTSHGIMFHHFYDAHHSRGQGAISASDLEEMIKRIGRENILDANEWQERALTRTLSPEQVCLTFDDTLLCQHDIALPVLDAHNIKAFWFAYSSAVTGGIELLEVCRKFRTVMFKDFDEFFESFFASVKTSAYADLVRERLEGFVPQEHFVAFPFYSDNDRTFRYVRDSVLGPEKYNLVMQKMLLDNKIDIPSFSSDLWMREHHIKKLHDKGHVIGLHSHTHPTEIALMPIEGQLLEYRTNFDILRGITGVAPRAVSHPCDSYSADTLAILKDLGVQLGFRATTANPTESPLEFPREDHANILAQMKI